MSQMTWLEAHAVSGATLRAIAHSVYTAVQDDLQHVTAEFPDLGCYLHYSRQLAHWTGLQADLFAHAYDQLRDVGEAGGAISMALAKQHMETYLAELRAGEEADSLQAMLEQFGGVDAPADWFPGCGW